MRFGSFQLSDIQRKTLAGYEAGSLAQIAIIDNQKKVIRKQSKRIARLEAVIRNNIKNGESFL